MPHTISPTPHCSTTRLVCKRATGHTDDPAKSRSEGPSAEAIRREITVLARCPAPGIVTLIAHGDRPAPWLETDDAGVETLESPPPMAATRVRALAALASVLSNLHNAGWAHLGLRPSHVVWRVQQRSEGQNSSDGQVEVTLCSLGSAVHPAGPAELYSDRESLAEIIVAVMSHSYETRPDNRVSAAVAALASELRSGDLDDLAAAALALDDLADAAARHDGTAAVRGDDGPNRVASGQRNDYRPPLLVGLSRLWAAAGRFAPAGRGRVGLVAALAVALGVGTLTLVTGSEPSASSAQAQTRCDQPAVAAPRVDPTGDGCGVRVGYRSGVLSVGTTAWSLGDDVIAGALVDTDADGWSELVALRDTGEVFLVRRFPATASQPVRVRAIASAPDARQLSVVDNGVGLAGVELVAADGSANALDQAVEAEASP